jgi:hypothetical protein
MQFLSGGSRMFVRESCLIQNASSLPHSPISPAAAHFVIRRGHAVLIRSIQAPRFASHKTGLLPFLLERYPPVGTGSLRDLSAEAVTVSA